MLDRSGWPSGATPGGFEAHRPGGRHRCGSSMPTRRVAGESRRGPRGGNGVATPGEGVRGLARGPLPGTGGPVPPQPQEVVPCPQESVSTSPDSHRQNLASPTSRASTPVRSPPGPSHAFPAGPLGGLEKGGAPAGFPASHRVLQRKSESTSSDFLWQGPASPTSRASTPVRPHPGPSHAFPAGPLGG